MTEEDGLKLSSDDFRRSYEAARKELAEGKFTDITSQAEAIANALGQAEGDPDRLYSLYDLAASKWEQMVDNMGRWEEDPRRLQGRLTVIGAHLTSCYTMTKMLQMQSYEKNVGQK